MELFGKIRIVTFHNKTNGFTVARLVLDQECYQKLHVENKLKGNEVVIVGCFDRMVLVDEQYQFEGDFIVDPTYGLQFKFKSFIRKIDESVEGIINYLSSDLFPGVGPKTAKNIVDKLGLKTIEIILKNPSALDGLGINSKIKQVIIDTINQNKNNQDIILFFLNYGLTMDVCHKIITNIGVNAIELVKQNPYILMTKLDYFGFIKNDSFAIRMGIKPDSPLRIKAAILYILKELIYNSGNSYVELPRLKLGLERFIPEANQLEDVFNEMITTLAVEKAIFISQEQNIFDYQLYLAETNLAKIIASKLTNPQLVTSFSEKQIENAYSKVASNFTIKLSSLQTTAVKTSFKNPLTIITGGPGTGKSTIVNFILAMFATLMNNDLVLDLTAVLAPTGRAAKRLKEITDFNAQTIHRYLGYSGENRFLHNKLNPTTQRFIIIDEASMMDLPLANQLFSALDPSARIIIVGDVDQLPSVGPGQILKDLIDSHKIPTIHLKQIHRQSEGSKIISLAHDANHGIVSSDITTKYVERTFFPCDEANLTKVLLELVSKLADRQKTLTKDIQVLAPMYKCPNGINELNQKLQALVNPDQHLPDIKIYGQSFRVNDKVIQLVNRSEKGVMNGDIGIIQTFIFKERQINGVSVLFDFGLVDYTLTEMEDLTLAYAISVHKAQGSEFDTVILPLSSSYQYMFKRKLIYTAITRAKKHLFLIGNIKSYQTGIAYIENTRLTILKKKLIDYLDPMGQELTKDDQESISYNQTKGNNIIQIDDQISAFSYIGEVFNDQRILTPYDFEDIIDESIEDHTSNYNDKVDGIQKPNNYQKSSNNIKNSNKKKIDNYQLEVIDIEDDNPIGFVEIKLTDND